MCITSENRFWATRLSIVLENYQRWYGLDFKYRERNIRAILPERYFFMTVLIMAELIICKMKKCKLF